LKISGCLAIATFSSALILPLFPGRPYWWEFAALLGWSGVAMTVAMRQYAPDFAQRVRANRLLFIGMIGYCLVLFVTMYYRGVGLRILGSGQVGGRFYFQQLTCIIFPILF
jgi:CHASE2 domain-containing sensor protein